MMADSSKIRSDRYRARRRTGEVWEPLPHGTAAAVRRHERDGSVLCEACRLERNRLARQKRARRRNVDQQR